MDNNYDEPSGFGILGKSKAMITPLSASTPNNVVDKKAEPTPVKLKTPDTVIVKEVKFASWGVDNKEPVNMILDIDAVPSSAQALNKRVESVYGMGPFLYKEVQDDDGKEMIKPIVYAEHAGLKTFLRNIRWKHYLLEAITDLEGLGNVFPEFIVTNDYSKIKTVRHQEAKHCRWSVKEDGKIKYCGISSEWGTDEGVTSENCTVVMVADPWMTVEEIRAWCKENSIKKFIYPVSFPSLGKTYYQIPSWNSARKAGWTEIAQLIPAAIKNTLKNANRMQWHVQIPYSYWETEFPKANYIDNPAQRKIDMDKKLENLDDFLAGAENSGKTLRTHYGMDPHTKKEYGGWKIDKLDGTPKFDKDILTTATANSEILFAWGVDPALIGQQTPGGQSNGAGSGSDKREADLILKGSKAKSDMIAEPIEFALEFNGFGDDIHLGFKKEILTTLDKNPTGSQKTGV